MEALVVSEYAGSSGACANEKRAAHLAVFAAQHLSFPAAAEVSITFVNNERMAELNETFRGKCGPTDVLSFECDNVEDNFPEGETFQAGDIIIAPDVAAQQAACLGHSFDEEIDTLLVHGMLHLIGFDHIEDDEAAEMQQHQDAILNAWWQTEAGAL